MKTPEKMMDYSTLELARRSSANAANPEAEQPPTAHGEASSSSAGPPGKLPTVLSSNSLAAAVAAAEATADAAATLATVSDGAYSPHAYLHGSDLAARCGSPSLSQQTSAGGQQHSVLSHLASPLGFHRPAPPPTQPHHHASYSVPNAVVAAAAAAYPPPATSLLHHPGWRGASLFFPGQQCPPAAPSPSAAAAPVGYSGVSAPAAGPSGAVAVFDGVSSSAAGTHAELIIALRLASQEQGGVDGGNSQPAGWFEMVNALLTRQARCMEAQSLQQVRLPTLFKDETQTPTPA